LKIGRRDFLKISGLAAAAAIQPYPKLINQEPFPEGERLGRIAVGVRREKGIVEIKYKPDYDSATVGTYLEDDVVVCYREVVGNWPLRNVQRWVETPDGYVWSPNVQPVQNNLNAPIKELPEGQEGIWVEVTVPWVNAEFENPPYRSSWWKLIESKFIPPRFYYSQILWVDKIKIKNDGKINYRVNERFGNPGDLLWVPAEALKPLSEKDIIPIHPEAEEKQIVIDASFAHQTLSCFEGNQEVYFCRVSTGATPAETPLSYFGSEGFNIYSKYNSIQMSGGTNEAGWMIPGIGWASFFYPGGIAIHSTFWHNNFGEPTSHGCINAAPKDAKWIYRWSNPSVGYQEGFKDVSGTTDGTRVKVIEY
jgi:hypothetical protein